MRNDAERTTELPRRRSRRTSAALEARLDDDGRERERRKNVVSREKMLRARGARIGQAREQRAARGEDTIEEGHVFERVRAVEPSARDDDSAPAGFERSLVRSRVDAERAAGPDGETSGDEVTNEHAREGARLGAGRTTADDGDAGQGGKGAAQVQGRRSALGGGEGAENSGVRGRVEREDDRGGHTRPSTARGASCVKSSRLSARG